GASRSAFGTRARLAAEVGREDLAQAVSHLLAAFTARLHRGLDRHVRLQLVEELVGGESADRLDALAEALVDALHDRVAEQLAEAVAGHLPGLAEDHLRDLQLDELRLLAATLAGPGALARFDGPLGAPAIAAPAIAVPVVAVPVLTVPVL